MKNLHLHLLLSLCVLSIVINGVIAQDAQTGSTYVVQVNDSLWKLADKYLGDGNLYPIIVDATTTMAAQNSDFKVISDPNIIVPGQRLWIPNAEGLAVVEPSPSPTTAVETNAPTSTPVIADATAAPATSLPATSPPATSPPAPTATRAASVSGAPSGHIAFSFWNREAGRCTYEIDIVSVPDCLQGPNQCQTTRRIFTLNSVSEPALSPDGTRLAFRGWGGPLSEDSPYLNCAPAHPHRYLGHTSLVGTEFTGFGGFWEDSHPDWSPDGNRLIFDTDRHKDGAIHLQVINSDGTNEQNLLIRGQQPSWAPDNFHFVYRGCGVSADRCGLWKGAAIPVKTWERGSNMLGPIVQGDQLAHPDWSPTRDEIVYQRVENGSWNLWIVNADGSNDHPLVTTPNLEGLPSWSPDGNWISYLFYDGQTWQIRIVSRDGSSDQHIFTYDGGQYVVPSAPQPYGVRDWIDEQISWSR